MKTKHLISFLIVNALIGLCAAQTVTAGMLSARAAICSVLFNIRDFLFYITSGVMVVTITLAGIRWIGSQEDAGERKRAKASVVHAVVGGIIVTMAVWIVLLIMPGAQCGII